MSAGVGGRPRFQEGTPVYHPPYPQPGGFPVPYGSHPYAVPGGPPFPGYGPEPGSWAARLAAYLIDSFLSTLLFYAVLAAGFFCALGVETLLEQNLRYGDPDLAAGITMLVGAALSFVLLFCYWWVPVARSGRTPGKRLLGLRIVSMATGGPPSTLRALGRYCLMVLFSITVVGFFLDCLWPLWDQPYRQSLHDKAVGTYVIRG